MKKISMTILWLYFFVPFTYTQVGRVGINTMLPKATLHVMDSSVLFTGPTELPVEAGPISESGTGYRTIWYADKAAFRTGGVSGTYWDKDNIGVCSFAAGYNTLAMGQYSVAIGEYSSAIGNRGIAMGWGTSALGESALATGTSTIALGFNSTSMGYQNHANGVFSTALGAMNHANGTASTVMGHSSIANSPTSFASGYNLIANGFSGTVIGLNNDSIVGTQNELTSETPLLIIGNGPDPSERQNAVVVRYDGRVGIGTSAPATRLHVQDSSVVFGGEYGNPNQFAEVPVSGVGSRMMWFADRYAFRAGAVNGPHWDTDSIGYMSIASGFQTVAYGHSSTSFGVNTRAAGYTAFSAGLGNMAIGDHSVAMGYNTKAKAYSSFSAGTSTLALKNESLALNNGTKADANCATSLGLQTIANATASLSIGVYNDPVIDPMVGYDFGTTHPLLIVGNGVSGNRSNAMVLYKSGRMGLGTNLPNTRLHVHEPATNKEVARFSASGTGFTEVSVANDINSLKLGIYGSNAYLGTAAEGSVYFKTNAQDRMTILNSGNVGIGTTSPGYRLDVSNPASNSIVASFRSGGGTSMISVSNLTQSFQMGVHTDYGYLSTNTGKDFILFTGAVPSLRVKANTGNIGIGIDAPSRKLHVYENASNTIISRFESAGGYGEINVTNGITTMDFGAHLDHGYLGTKAGDLRFRTSAQVKMTLTDAGNLGIGTTTPGSLLEVNGVASKPGGGTWSAASDARLKQNVTPFADGLEKILSIQPVSYQYNERSGFDTSLTYVGVIAQELEAVAPYMVNVSEKELADGSTGYLEVNNSAMIYMLINGMKEQQQIINQLQERIILLEKN